MDTEILTVIAGSPLYSMVTLPQKHPPVGILIGSGVVFGVVCYVDIQVLLCEFSVGLVEK